MRGSGPPAAHVANDVQPTRQKCRNRVCQARASSTSTGRVPEVTSAPNGRLGVAMGHHADDDRTELIEKHLVGGSRRCGAKSAMDDRPKAWESSPTAAHAAANATWAPPV